MIRVLLLSLALLAAGWQSGAATAQADEPFLTRQFAAKNFVISVEDLTLTLRDGSVLQGEVHGVTTLALVGNGSMRFSPPPEAEKSQMRLLGGKDVLESPFDVAIVRLMNSDNHADVSPLSPQVFDTRMVRRAYEAFPDLRVSADAYATTFLPGDVIGDIRTSRVGKLRYMRSGSALEAISLVADARTPITSPSPRTLSIYPSTEQRALRGRSLREDENAEYDVVHHDVSIAYEPERRFIDATAAMRVRVTAAEMTSISFRLADTLRIHSVTIPGAGPVDVTRSPAEESWTVRLPAPLQKGAEATLVVAYSGVISPPAAEWDMPAAPGTPPLPALEHAQLTSTFPMWYPRPPFIDFATATMRISVPEAFDCVATGELEEGSPALDRTTAPARKLFTFTARQPLRHLAFLVAPFTLVSRTMLTVDDGPPGADGTMSLVTVAQSRTRMDAPGLAKAAADIVQFYRSILGSVPYPSLTVALVDGQVPGGHSAAYFSVLGSPPPGTTPFWRDDPAAYDRFPNFVLAHEIAHQWWGQALGWASYHDQWITEAFAQYFATLHAGHQSGPAPVAEILARMRTFAMSESPKGPLSLGPRLGVIQNDDSVFRALLYNKGPAVLHMLRRFIGDEAFFAGTRRFLAEGRFQKPSTDDLRRAMEGTSGRPLERFFDRWIYGSALPRLRFSYRVESAGGTGAAVLRVEQTGELFDLPVTLVLQYEDRPPAQEIVRVTDRITEVRVPLAGRLRRAEVSRSDGTLAEIR